MDLLNSTFNPENGEQPRLEIQDPPETTTNDARSNVSDVADESFKSVVYVEARMRKTFDGDSRDVVLTLQKLFESGHIYVLGLEVELMELRTNMSIFPEGLESVKAVEFICKSPQDYLAFLDGRSSTYQINVYKLHEEIETHPTLPGKLTLMPNTRFEGTWERLVFETDIRENVLRVLANMFKFSQRRAPGQHRRMNPLVLFTGQPGTGKTSLALAVIQKLAIRLNFHYKRTRLLHVAAAPLLSKYFGESAQRISEMFDTIHSMCVTNPGHFLCVLIDEVESLVSSRKAADERNEIQDTIRATNALLTGIDLVRHIPNLVILCTSNLISTLDNAFMDRVGRHINMEQPSLAGRYRILCDGFGDMIAIGVVTTTEILPTFRNAQCQLLSRPSKPSSILIRLAERLSESKAGFMRSARNLGQIVEVAMADRMRTETCSLEQALQHLMDFLDCEERSRAKEDDSIHFEMSGALDGQGIAQKGPESKFSVLGMDEERPAKKMSVDGKVKVIDE